MIERPSPGSTRCMTLAADKGYDAAPFFAESRRTGALGAEADAFVVKPAKERFSDGRYRDVWHGYGLERSMQAVIGGLDMRRPTAARYVVASPR